MTCNIPKLRIFIIIFSLIISFGIVKKVSAAEEENASSSQDHYLNDHVMGSFYVPSVFAQRLNYITNPVLNPYLNVSKLSFHSYNCDFADSFVSAAILKCYTSTWGETSDYVNNLYSEMANGGNDYEANVVSPPYSANLGDCVWIWASSSMPYSNTNHTGCFNPLKFDTPLVLNSYGYDGIYYSDYWFIASTSLMTGNPGFSTSFEPEQTVGLAGNNDNDYAMIYSQASISTSTWQGMVPYKVWNETDPAYTGSTTVDTTGPYEYELVDEQREIEIWSMCDDDNVVCPYADYECVFETDCKLYFSYSRDADEMELQLADAYCIYDYMDLYEDVSAALFDYLVNICEFDSKTLYYSNMRKGDYFVINSNDFDIVATDTPITEYVTFYWHSPTSTDPMWFQSRINFIPEHYLSGIGFCDDMNCTIQNNDICDDIYTATSTFWQDIGQQLECFGRRFTCWSICPSIESIQELKTQRERAQNGFPLNIASFVKNNIDITDYGGTVQAPVEFQMPASAGGDKVEIADLLDTTSNNFYGTESYDIYNQFRTIVVYLMYTFLFAYIILRIAKMAQKE